MKNIRTKKGLETLLSRYQQAGASEEWIKEIQYCIETQGNEDEDERLGMDETDYENTPKELKPLWKNLR